MAVIYPTSRYQAAWALRRCARAAAEMDSCVRWLDGHTTPDELLTEATTVTAAVKTLRENIQEYRDSLPHAA